MKLILPAVLAAALSLPAEGFAATIEADARSDAALLVKVDDKGKHRGKGRGKGDDRDERRAYREGFRDGRRQARERGYYQPGFRDDRSDYRRYGRGQYLPREYRTYVINDYHRFGYPPPPRGYHYVRVGQDTYLTQIATGLILNAFLGGGY